MNWVPGSSGPLRRRRHRTPLAAAALLLALLVAARLWFTHPADHDTQPAGLQPAERLETWQPTTEVPAERTYAVKRVVDGDTLLLSNRARVRLLGINTPEIAHEDRPAEPLGPEATEFTRRFIGDRPVQLRLDHERVDKYGRWLAYVYVDGKLLNEALLRAGLAEIFHKANCSAAMKKRLRDAETEARQNGRGIWSIESSGKRGK